MVDMVPPGMNPSGFAPKLTAFPTASRAFDGPNSGSCTLGPGPIPQTPKVCPKSLRRRPLFVSHPLRGRWGRGVFPARTGLFKQALSLTLALSGRLRRPADELGQAVFDRPRGFSNLAVAP